MNKTLLLISVDQNYKYSRKSLYDEIIKFAIPKLIKKLREGIVSDEDMVKNLANVFSLKYLRMLERMKKEVFYGI